MSDTRQHADVHIGFLRQLPANSTWLVPPVAVALSAFIGWGATTLPPVIVIGLVAATLASVAALLAPVGWVVTGWAVLIPIWSVGSLDPALFDVARAWGALLVIVRTMRFATRPGWGQIARSWVWPLGAVMTFVAAVAFSRGDGRALSNMTVALVALSICSLVMARIDNPMLIFRGFAAGTTISAVVLLLTAFGMSAGTPQTRPGLHRLTGLAPSAPRVAIELAAAIVICWVITRTSDRWRVLAATGGLTCMAALLLSGGRIGLASLIVACVIALVRRWIRPGTVVGLIAAAGVGTYLASVYGRSANTLERLFSGGDQAIPGIGIVDDRLDTLRAAAHELWRTPVLGPGLEQFHDMYGLLPHQAPLSFAMAGGLAAGAVMVVMCVRLVLVVVRRPAAVNPTSMTGVLVLAVLATAIPLEPDGPFVGVEAVTLLLASLCAVSSPSAIARKAQDARPFVKV